MDKNKVEIEQANVNYFQSFIYSRASLSGLQVFPFIAAFFLGFEAFGFWGYYQAEGFTSFAVWSYLYIFLTIICLLTGLVSLKTKLMYKHQVIFSWLFALTIVLLTVGLSTVGYLMITNNATNETVYLTTGRVFVPLTILLFLSSISVNVLLLKQRLKVGFSEKRAQKNYFALSGVFGRIGFGVILGVTLIGGILAKSITAVFGIGLTILFVTVFPSVIVEFGYLAYLKGKNRQYWEVVSDKQSKTPVEKKRALLKLIKRGYIITSVIIVIVLGNIYKGASTPTIISAIDFVVMMSWLIIFILWLIKKIRNRKKNKNEIQK